MFILQSKMRYLNNFQILEEAFEKKIFFIIGAGASVPIIETTAQQGKRIIQIFKDFGSTSVTEKKIDSGAKRLLGNAYYSGDQFEQALIKRIPQGAIRAVAQRQMTYTGFDKKCDQYLVLNLAIQGSVIFNMNVDGLAELHCKRHIVLDPHGTIRSEAVNSKLWDEIISWCFEYDLESPKFPNVILPGPEPRGIINNSKYQCAAFWYPYMEYAIIIGCFFGYDENKDAFDDWETYYYFCDLFKQYPKPIIIINLYGADHLADMLCNSLQRSDIYTITADWRCLAKAIFKKRQLNKMFPCEKELNKMSLVYIYNAIRDNSNIPRPLRAHPLC